MRKATRGLQGTFCCLSRRKRPHIGKKAVGEEAAGFGYGMHAQHKVAVVYLPWKGLQRFSLLRKLNNTSVKYKTVYITITSPEVAGAALNLGSTLS